MRLIFFFNTRINPGVMHREALQAFVFTLISLPLCHFNKEKQSKKSYAYPYLQVFFTR